MRVTTRSAQAELYRKAVQLPSYYVRAKPPVETPALVHFGSEMRKLPEGIMGAYLLNQAKEQTTMTDWNKGDIVELKTGGPPMTIDRIRPDGRVRCFWFKGTERYSGSFDSETLKSPPEATAPMVVT